RGKTVAPAVECVARGGDQLGTVRETEVIVGAKVQHALAAGDRDVRGLVRGDDALALEQPGGFDLGEGLAEIVGVRRVHEIGLNAEDAKIAGKLIENRRRGLCVLRVKKIRFPSSG